MQNNNEARKTRNASWNENQNFRVSQMGGLKQILENVFETNSGQRVWNSWHWKPRKFRINHWPVPGCWFENWKQNKSKSKFKRLKRGKCKQWDFTKSTRHWSESKTPRKLRETRNFKLRSAPPPTACSEAISLHALSRCIVDSCQIQ